MNTSSAKIKVCHLASGDLWAGAEVQVLNVCRGLLESGAVDLRAIVLNNGRLADELKSLGVIVSIVNEQAKSSLQILWELLQYFRMDPIDILHTHRYKENILGSAAAKMARVPHTVRTVHGTTEFNTGWKRAKIRIYKAMDDLVSRYLVDRFVGVSQEITADLRSAFPRKIVEHIPNCVDEDRLVPNTGRDEKRKDLGVKASEFVIGTVGRLTPVKGTEYLIRAVPAIIKHYEGVRILIVGEGPLRTDLEELSQSLGLEKKVTFLGWRPDAVDVLNCFDLFVLPSLHEGLPTVLLEAMSLGVPVVACATGGITELIRNAWNGLLVDPRNQAALAEKCLSIIADSSLASRLVRNAKQTSQKHKYSETVPFLVCLYGNLMDDTCAKRAIL